MKIKIIARYIFLAIFFLVVGFTINKFYTAKHYVMIERTKAENIEDKTKPVKEEYITLPKDQIGQFSTLFEVYKELSESHINKVETKKLIDGAINGMTEATNDIYTSFTPISADQETIEDSLSTNYKGIGAEVTLMDGYAVITNPYKNAPAYKAGVMPYDRVLKVDGEDVVGKELHEIVSKIKGEKGTDVVLTLARGTMEPFDVTITRDEINVQTVIHKMIEEKDKSIGLIEITSFAENTESDFSKALKELEKEGMDGLVIDVRNNGGGYLEAVQKISSEILPIGKTVLKMEDRKGNRKVVRSTGLMKNKKEYPIVLLVSGSSASASEVLAGALKDSGKYPIVGEKTFGKGTVQELRKMDDGSELKITIAKWLTPNGIWVHEKGIEPDIAVETPPIFFVPGIQTNEEKPFKLGDVSENVAYAQELLQLLDYNVKETNGYFGEDFKAVLQTFQKDKNLEETGELDKETVFVMNQTLLEVKDDDTYDEQLKKAIEVVTDKKE